MPATAKKCDSFRFQSFAHYKKTGAEFNDALQKSLARAENRNYVCSQALMPKANLAKLLGHRHKPLRPEVFSDWDGAANGLQVEYSGAVTKIAIAVDASLATLKLAVAARADLMLVHHGLFWWQPSPDAQSACQNDLAVYISHLPLDAHRRLDNNAQLCAAPGFNNLKPIFQVKGRSIGWPTITRIPVKTLRRNSEKSCVARRCSCPAAANAANESASSQVAPATN
jgi:putative NIF3 family GTP cyclohydrolase 1 type 2